MFQSCGARFPTGDAIDASPVNSRSCFHDTNRPTHPRLASGGRNLATPPAFTLVVIPVARQDAQAGDSLLPPDVLLACFHVAVDEGCGPRAEESIGADRGLPRIPASAGALIWDRAGRLLILKPTYKSGWTIPGGVVEADGESPWQACRREAGEECGLDVRHGRLVCVDFLHPRPGRPGGMRFLFDCGVLKDLRLARIVLQEEEISAYRLARVDRALRLFSGPVRRRVAAAVNKPGRTHYLEDGRPVR
jgi:8-oxo-dGTP diphosphatase